MVNFVVYYKDGVDVRLVFGLVKKIFIEENIVGEYSIVLFIGSWCYGIYFFLIVVCVFVVFSF